MKERVMELLQKLISIDSESRTEKERYIEAFLLQTLESMKGVTARSVVIQEDIYRRAIVYGFVRGTSANTVVFLNHHDTVGIAPYGRLAKNAFSPDELLEDLLQKETNTEVLSDLRSGEWLVGRGSCDMKGGIAAQLAVLEEYGMHPGKATVLFLSIPDEESYSVGMRAAMPLLKLLQKNEGFNYRILINNEPSPKEGDALVACTGSVGKVLPVIVVQGKPVHVGKYTEGLNPIGLLARIVAQTEGNMELVDRIGDEMAPPPAWMYMRDRKEKYDVSLPYHAAGWINFLTYQKTPADVAAILKRAAEKAAKEMSPHIAVRIMTGAELLDCGKGVEGFDIILEHLYHTCMIELEQGKSSYAEATISMITHILAYLHITEPTVVIAFAPPFYPSSQSRLVADDTYNGLLEVLSRTAKITYKQYFNGISDCSYCCIDSRIKEHMLQGNLLLWGEAYSLHFSTMAELQIPFLLLGPWGKDLHERTERVHIDSVSCELPIVLQRVIEYVGDAKA